MDQDFWYKVDLISLSEYSKLLGQELPIYGDFLSNYLVNVGELSSDMHTDLIDLGTFYQELNSIREGMLKSYIDLAARGAGYYVARYFSPHKSEGNLDGEMKDRLMKDTLWGRGFQRKGIGILEEYVNQGNQTECLRLLILDFGLSPIDGFHSTILFPSYKPSEILKSLKAELDEGHRKKTRIVCESVSKFVIVDPLVYAALNKMVNELKTELAETVGKSLVLQPSDLLDFLGIENAIFEHEWEGYRRLVSDDLRERYRFLAVESDARKIAKAQDELDSAQSLMTKGDNENCMIQVALACERLLAVMCRLARKKFTPSKDLGELLKETRDYITSDLGKDIYEDLQFIKQKRDDVTLHSRARISDEDALKTIGKARLFYQMVLHKVKSNLKP